MLARQLAHILSWLARHLLKRDKWDVSLMCLRPCRKIQVTSMRSNLSSSIKSWDGLQIMLLAVVLHVFGLSIVSLFVSSGSERFAGSCGAPTSVDRTVISTVETDLAGVFYSQ